MKKSGLIVSGALSIIIGVSLIGRAYYEKLIKQNKDSSDEYKITNDRKNNNDEIIKQSKIDGYTIFRNSVGEYLRSVETELQTFEDFMEKQWPSDAKIYKENNNNSNSNSNSAKNDDNNNAEISCKRSYKSWENMYDAIKNGVMDVDKIMKIGEQEHDK